jgi:ribosome-binding factor A
MRTNQYGSSRVSHDVQRALSRIISELKDPRIGLMTSVTRCEVTKDLKECKCYISVLGDEEATMQGLESAKGFIRKQLASSLNLRNTPEIDFVSDHSIAYGVDMSKRIDEVLSQDRQAKEE